MTETEFRVKHSELVEYYQLIEMRLRFICADLMADKDRGWFERLDDYELDPFGTLLKKIKEYQQQKQKTLLTEDDFAKLEDVRKTRNYWVHQCFGLHDQVLFRKGSVRNPMHAQKILMDFDEAVEWDEKLTDILKQYVKER